MIGRPGNRCLMWHASASMPSCLYSSRTTATDVSSKILYGNVAARRELHAITLRLQSCFAELQHMWTVIDAQQGGKVHGHTIFVSVMSVLGKVTKTSLQTFSLTSGLKVRTCKLLGSSSGRLSDSRMVPRLSFATLRKRHGAVSTYTAPSEEHSRRRGEGRVSSLNIQLLGINLQPRPIS
jgi:hypothetical protein